MTVPRARILPASHRRAVPWKNGGGVTFPVASSPDGVDPTAPFDWRVSIASISRDGGFSTFTGIDRVIVVIDGAGVVLTVNGATVPLGPLAPYAFAGEAEVSGRLVEGATLDLNLMTRRGKTTGSMEVIRLPEQGLPLSPTQGETIVAVCLSAGGCLGDVVLQPRDAVIVDFADTGFDGAAGSDELPPITGVATPVAVLRVRKVAGRGG
ncbi:HutD family protein [Jatrophihabitans telluris]|uniref:HutD family protein n=1 Tax=Jatrophihabitans telluris TaxID=2038343 RepID=A0ABY4QYN9_9ACTN|nr:HutD family protein [Jatrophihabitans telluris]UQX88242.1 HutD family protein [Jatrophihabitans telluris]